MFDRRRLIALAGASAFVALTLDALGVVIVGSTPEALATHLKDEMDTWGPVIKAANIKVTE
jgi:tripartite-type tricarboxylate transporter receptor subunit TctC